jgi:hypothetical protein
LRTKPLHAAETNIVTSQTLAPGSCHAATSNISVTAP